LCDDDVVDDEDDRSCSNVLSIVFIALPAVDEHVNAAPSADHFIPARNSQPSRGSAHHVMCPIPGYQQDVKHGIPDEVDAKWIKANMARTTLYIQSIAAEFSMRLKKTKDCIVVAV
jgi:hypothetical protein